MRGCVICMFRGGPWDGKVEEVPIIHCREELRVRDTWIEENPDGSAAVCRGELGPRWTSFLAHVYAKRRQGHGTPGAIYEFVESVAVNRCAQILADKGGRRCKNEAIAGGELCRQHEAIRARAVGERP